MAISRVHHVALALAASLACALAADDFMFAGLSRRTTIEDARKQYRHSAVVGRHIYVAEVDSHNHIYGIDLPSGPGPSGQLRVYFERNLGDRNVYPVCEDVAATIRKQYGEPTNIQDFAEERSRNRRLIWSHPGEELSLLCFRIRPQQLMAAELTISGR